MAKVAIFGGGVGGLSAAHELIERGFEVTVYEQRDIWGGKARSYGAKGTSTRGHHDLPGEHGFRLFPGFYKHVIDTMKRIPVAGNCTVFDNLVSIDQMLLASEKRPPLALDVAFPKNIAEWARLPHILSLARWGGIPEDETRLFIRKLLILLTSCQERRLAEYERWPWWDFIEAEGKSEAYQKLLGEGLTRKLVAMHARQASTRTVGDIGIQLMQDFCLPGRTSDRVLRGPTNEFWIDPWVAFLRRKGVDFNPNASLQRLECHGKRIRAAMVRIGKNEIRVEADYYVCAVPVEVMSRLLTPELKDAAPSMAHLDRLHTEWMVGIQLYLKRDIPVYPGHVIYLDSTWALTSISQHQFWPTVDLSHYGNGEVRGILSVDISNWTARGDKVVHKAAEECTREEIEREVWAQIKAHLAPMGQPLEDADLVGSHLDSSISFPRKTADQDPKNVEPLLVNTEGSWQYRPEADLSNGLYREIPNLFLAADYVRTYTDLATMEGANEAARRAVNGILRAANSSKELCTLWPLEELAVFAPARAVDYLRFKMGYAHDLSLPAPLKRPMTVLARWAPPQVRKGFLDLNRYRFEDKWYVSSPPAAVWPLVSDVERFPLWWPQFRKVQRCNHAPEIGAEWNVEIHSRLPYSLTYTLKLAHRREAELVEWEAEGDLNGRVSFTLTETPGGTSLLYRSDMRTGNPIMNLLAPVSKPLFRWNHDEMMKQGQAGLQSALAVQSLVAGR